MTKWMIGLAINCALVAAVAVAAYKAGEREGWATGYIEGGDAVHVVYHEDVVFPEGVTSYSFEYPNNHPLDKHWEVPAPLAYGDGYGDIAPPTASTHFSSPGPIVIEGDSTATGRSHAPTYLEQLKSARSTEISGN